MATTHIKRSNSASRLVNYAEKRAVLKDGINIDVDYAKTQLKQVREIYGNSGSTEAYASRISFSPRDFDVSKSDDQRKALEVARQIYEKTYPNQQVALYEHADTDSLHIHAVIGAIDLETGKKMHGNWNDYREKLVRNTDEIVQQYGLEVTKPDPERYEKRTMAEIKLAEKGKSTWKDEIRNSVDSVMSNIHISDFKTFKEALKEKAIDVYERGKNLTYQLTGTNYKARGNKLGTAYEKETIFNELERRTNQQRTTERINPPTEPEYSSGNIQPESNTDRSSELSRNANSATKHSEYVPTRESNRDSEYSGHSNETVSERNRQPRIESDKISGTKQKTISEYFVGISNSNKSNHEPNDRQVERDKSDNARQQQNTTEIEPTTQRNRSSDYGRSR